MSSTVYSLRKSRHIFQWANGQYRKHWRKLSREKLKELEGSLEQLDEALVSSNRAEASAIAQAVEEFGAEHLNFRAFGAFFKELIFAAGIALLIAVVVRQMWFELYQIPTGSMRPTFKETDHLLVSKTSFGINVPLQPQHLYFDPDLVKRTGVVVFTAENLDVPDADTTYFWLFNAKKRYIKRMIGKPGDSLYFYGGKIYGVDRDGNDLTVLRDSPWMENLEHIPFDTFDGRITYQSPEKQEPHQESWLFSHTNLPIGKLSWTKDGRTTGELLSERGRVPEEPLAALEPHDRLKSYSDFWGMQNFAMCRLLTADQVRRFTDHRLHEVGEGTLYLELFHTPGLTYPVPEIRRSRGNGFVRVLTPFSTLIPLQKQHLEGMMDHMYTARFSIKDGKGYQYTDGNVIPSNMAPSFPNLPDGMFEFYHGEALQIGWMGSPTVLAEDHPLYSYDPTHIQKFFNLGVQMYRPYEPLRKEQPFLPKRYAYFRDGDLYLMGAPILTKDDPTLIAFVEKEELREKAGGSQSYIAFKDRGAPLLEDGSIDKEFVRTFGLRVPDKHYFALGDNHAMSADSRYFGFVPEDNLRGTPIVTIWPWDDRLGRPPQVDYPCLTVPRMMVWGVIATICLGFYACHHRRKRRLQFRKVSK